MHATHMLATARRSATLALAEFGIFFGLNVVYKLMETHAGSFQYIMAQAAVGNQDAHTSHYLEQLFSLGPVAELMNLRAIYVSVNHRGVT